MREALSLCASYLAFALLHAADGPHPPAWAGASSRLRRGTCRLVALALLALAYLSWRRIEGTTAALLVVAASMCLSATTFVVMAAFLPRLAWRSALFGAVVMPVLIWGAFLHG